MYQTSLAHSRFRRTAVFSHPNPKTETMAAGKTARRPNAAKQAAKVPRKLHNLVTPLAKSMNVDRTDEKFKQLIATMVDDAFDRIAAQAAQLSAHAKRSTVTSLDVQNAVRILAPGDLGKHMVSQGRKAVTMFTSHA